MIRDWFRSGRPWIWLNAAAVSTSVIAVVALILLIAFHGLAHFWPAQVMEAEYNPPNGEPYRLIGTITDSEQVAGVRLRDSGVPVDDVEKLYTRYTVKTGNRQALGMDFRPILAHRLSDISTPEDLMVLERREWGDFIGRLKTVREEGEVVAEGDAARPALMERLERARGLAERIEEIESGRMADINYQIDQLRLDRRGLELRGVEDESAYAAIEEQKAALEAEFADLHAELDRLKEQAQRDSLTAEIMDGRVITVPLANIVRLHYPNEMGWTDAVGHYLTMLWNFVSEEPREANTEGGIFPAIFGTVVMVLLMSVFVTPFGIIAAIYIREYARQGPVIRTIRIAVNNLAGVPSIVYGVFGLGFFVYMIGGTIDQVFFPEALPSPTFGTPGLLWASLTLALLTLPVVIVATEEGLARVPRSVREGSLALGATKAETLWRTVLPMASPAMMTGLILAVARAAGEVAPLMLVGVVKLAPSLPLDGNFPFLHLERKFMHLGFHIYDVGFQSPNVEAARPLVYATALLLIVIIVALNLVAISIRNRLREKYRNLES